MDVVSDMFLHHWELEFSELDQTQGHHLLPTTVSASGCQLPPCGPKVSPVTKQPFWFPISPCQQAPLLLASSNYNSWQTNGILQFLVCINFPLFPHFVFSTIQVLLESMFPGIECSVHADKTLLIPFIDCLLIFLFINCCLSVAYWLSMPVTHPPGDNL